MEARFGVHGTECEAVFFTEAAIPGARVLEHISVEISRQNASLSEVKNRLAQSVRQKGGNALMNFRYGQKAHKWYEQVLTLKWDSESWYGEGDVVSA